MIVADLMTRNAASVRSGQTLAAAVQVMWDCVGVEICWHRGLPTLLRRLNSK
jgi:hypothetical protein